MDFTRYAALKLFTSFLDYLPILFAKSPPQAHLLIFFITLFSFPFLLLSSRRLSLFLSPSSGRQKGKTSGFLSPTSSLAPSQGRNTLIRDHYFPFFALFCHRCKPKGRNVFPFSNFQNFFFFFSRLWQPVSYVSFSSATQFSGLKRHSARNR